ncbi:uncharacterized protein LOC126829964 [Patella vulgata]|uniref:uncharacterized protein LOC126829964 n=1 Tax=Patella vulgata TaxID=6465 RepID=UPI00217FF56A|nr:uncharacterized protein LOC126829964 [Patella vulgata]
MLTAAALVVLFVCTLVCYGKDVSESTADLMQEEDKTDLHEVKRFLGRWKSSNHIWKHQNQLNDGVKLELDDKSPTTGPKRFTNEHGAQDNFAYLLNNLQANEKSENDYLNNAKRHFGRWRNSNQLWKSLKGLSKSDQNSVIDQQRGLVWTKRFPEEEPEDMAKRFYGRWRNSDHMMKLLASANKNDKSDIINKHRGITWSKRDNTDNVVTDKANSRAKRFIGRWKNSNYIWSRVKGGADNLSNIMRRHWNMNWNKRDSSVAASQTPKSSNLPDNSDDGKPKRQIRKRFLVDMDYSFLWSLLMNQDRPEARRLLNLYIKH